MTEIYIITREGVYRHEIVGVSSTEQGARALALLAARNERDDYHAFHLGKAEIDTSTPLWDITILAVLTRKDTRDKHDRKSPITSSTYTWTKP